MTSAQLISWVVSAITFGTVIMFGCIGETINQKAGNLNLGVPGIMQLGGIGALTGALKEKRLVFLRLAKLLEFNLFN